MKFIVILLCAAFALVAGDVGHEEEVIKTALTKVFRITKTEAESCVHVTGVTRADMELLGDVIMENMSGEVDKQSLKRASCTLACCANIQGMMSGATLEISNIHHEIHKLDIPPEAKRLYHDVVNLCSTQVKQITDKCDVCFHLIKCVALQMQNASI